MPILQKLHFCSYLVRISIQTLKDTLKMLSGDSYEASLSLLEATGWPDQSWEENLTNSYVFFCTSGATDLFRRRVAKATCTKYRACAQKLSAVFRGLAGIGPRPVYSNTARTPIAKAIWGMIWFSSWSWR